VILTDLEIGADEFASRTGWSIKPEGACKEDLCVPLPSTAAPTPGTVDVEVVAGALGMPIARDDAHGLVAVGPETTVTGRALTTARAPELELPDVDGQPFRLSSLRGQKVMLLAWASW
jgi:hypothetical protein